MVIGWQGSFIIQLPANPFRRRHWHRRRGMILNFTTSKSPNKELHLETPPTPTSTPSPSDLRPLSPIALSSIYRPSRSHSHDESPTSPRPNDLITSLYLATDEALPQPNQDLLFHGSFASLLQTQDANEHSIHVKFLCLASSPTS